MLKLKNWHNLNYEDHFYLCVQRKTNAFLDVYGRFWKFPKVYLLFFMTVFIRRASEVDNAASECTRTVAATYGCKILQLFEYDANVYGYDASCE